MGKGQGRGRGKGGCECCEAIHAFACCLCLVLIGGPILIAIGGTILAAADRNDRGHDIDSVQAAVDRWNDPNSPNGWNQFQKLPVYAVAKPGNGADAGCTSQEAQLTVDKGAVDTYYDEVERFRRVQQLRLTVGLNYGRFFGCNQEITLYQLAADGSNRTLATLADYDRRTLDYSIFLDKADGPKNCPTRSDACYGTNYKNCRSNCEEHFRGVFNCNNGIYRCDIMGAYYDSLAIKVTHWAATGAQPAMYRIDAESPGTWGGANVLPFGFVRQYTAPNRSSLTAGPIFQVPNIRPYPTGQPTSLEIVVRSSTDPWLTYMFVTDGSGYFGVAKHTLVASGVVLVVLGCLGTLFWFVAAFYAWRMLCSRSRPTSRPEGMGGYAWDLANRYGGQYAPAVGMPVHGTGQDGLPTAQPLYIPAGGYGQPAHGFPYPGYPTPYGPPQPGAYSPYPYPTPYPAGHSIEMTGNMYGSMQQQPYAYPPPAPGQQPYAAPMQQQSPPTDANGGATAAYSYPYPYQYPPYGQPPAPGPSGAMLSGPSAAEAAAGSQPGFGGGGSTRGPSAGPGPSGPGPSSSQPPPGYPKA